MKNTRFELEQKLLSCWSITDDLDTLAEAVMEEKVDADSIANILLGLKEIYNLRFESTFSCFEECIKTREI